jgi:hypothetical protein
MYQYVSPVSTNAMQEGGAIQAASALSAGLNFQMANTGLGQGGRTIYRATWKLSYVVDFSNKNLHYGG